MSLYKKATPPILDYYSNAEEFHNPLFTENEVQYDEVDEVIYDEVGHEVDYDEVEEVIEQYDTVDEQGATDHYKADEEIIYDEMQDEGEMDV